MNILVFQTDLLYFFGVIAKNINLLTYLIDHNQPSKFMLHDLNLLYKIIQYIGNREKKNRPNNANILSSKFSLATNKNIV